ncbi:MAG: branched-chain amino acid ABC transporter permease [archaeon]
MSIVLQLLINGLIAGSIYALVASGFSLVYNIQKFFHIAHGAIFVVSAFLAYTFNIILGLPLWSSIILTIIAAAFIGILVDFLVYKPLRKNKNPELALFLVSFGVFIFIQSLVLLFFGAEVRSFGLPVEKGMDFFGAIITPLQVVIIVVSLVSLVLLYVFLKKTKLGKALRAMADDKETASTLGINVEKLTILTFGLSSSLAAVAGILVGLEQHLEQAMGFMAILKGITAAIIGGIGNVPASIIGGYFLGIVENYGIWFLPSGYKDAIAFVILILFLLFRPRGLFGTKKRKDVG